jgi:ketosteroid isomerase-like protein
LQRLEEWFGSFATPIDYSITEILVTVSGDVAFDHHLVHVAGTNVKGEVVDMWFRETVGWKRSGGEWKVTHQHSSVPFDMKSGMAKLDLAPRTH